MMGSIGGGLHLPHCLPACPWSGMRCVLAACTIAALATAARAAATHRMRSGCRKGDIAKYQRELATGVDINDADAVRWEHTVPHARCMRQMTRRWRAVRVHLPPRGRLRRPPRSAAARARPGGESRRKDDQGTVPRDFVHGERVMTLYRGQAAGHRSGEQPLHAAASGGHLAVVSELLDQHGVDPDAETDVRAQRARGARAAPVPTRCGAPTLQSGMTPLHFASGLGHEAVAEALARRVASPDAANQVHLLPSRTPRIALRGPGVPRLTSPCRTRSLARRHCTSRPQTGRSRSCGTCSRPAPRLRRGTRHVPSGHALWPPSCPLRKGRVGCPSTRSPNSGGQEAPLRRPPHALTPSRSLETHRCTQPLRAGSPRLWRRCWKPARTRPRPMTKAMRPPRTCGGVRSRHPSTHRQQRSCTRWRLRWAAWRRRGTSCRAAPTPPPRCADTARLVSRGGKAVVSLSAHRGKRTLQ